MNDLGDKMQRLVQARWDAAHTEQALTETRQRHRRGQRLRAAALVGGPLLLLLLLLPRLRGGAEHQALPLSAETRLSQPRSEMDRVVIELQAGEARFASGARRLQVRAGDVAVTGSRARFVVGRLRHGVRVAVSDGQVQVRWSEKQADLGAGQSGTFPPETAAAAPEVGPRGEVARSETEPAQPAQPQRAPIQPAPAPPRGQRWKALAQEGRFDQAYGALPGAQLSEVTDEPGDLLLLADVARLSRHPKEAVAPLQKVVRRHGRDPRAPLAAFTLGRVLLDDLGRPQEAAHAFEQARRLDEGGAMAQDALAREVEAWSRAGEGALARERAAEYLRRYPDGRRLQSVRRYGALE